MDFLCFETFKKKPSLQKTLVPGPKPCSGVEDVFNALKPEMQQITSREEVGAGVCEGPGWYRREPGDRLNKGPIKKVVLKVFS